MTYMTRLFWFTNDESPATRDHTTEESARGWAEKRSSEVQGRVDIIIPEVQHGKRVEHLLATYKGGDLVSAS